MTNLTIHASATILVEVLKETPTDWIARGSEPDFPYRHHDGTPLTEEDVLCICKHERIRHDRDMKCIECACELFRAGSDAD